MLFNSFEYIALFLPVTLIVYFSLNRAEWFKTAKIWLLGASLFFYSWWNPVYLPLILASMIFNYYVGAYIGNVNNQSKKRKQLLTLGVVSNVLLLGYFKYSNFFLENVSVLMGTEMPTLNIILPLAISFFTFQQIAYLSDSYKGVTQEYDFLHYALFVAFFPQLIAGPIVHHSAVIPQIKRQENQLVNYTNLSAGLYMFFMGLCKKLIIADTFAAMANAGYAQHMALGFAESWMTSIAYAIQLYFDFSGYSDMAIGAALMFNIKLPQNFNSPYHAQSIQDFWRRWHMTLSAFLRDYIYIPLGGNRKGELRMFTNLLTTFLVGGIWHGAGWTFVVWGAMHGFGLIIHRMWQKLGVGMNKYVAIFITFNFVNIAWVFFRATSFDQALVILGNMFGFNGFSTDINFYYDFYSIPVMVVGVVFLFLNNTNIRLERFAPNTKHLAYSVAMVVLGLLFLNSVGSSEFLYFDF